MYALPIFVVILVLRFFFAGYMAMLDTLESTMAIGRETVNAFNLLIENDIQWDIFFRWADKVYLHETDMNPHHWEFPHGIQWCEVVPNITFDILFSLDQCETLLLCVLK